MCKQQSCHKLVVGNWNITSLIGKEHELVEEAKRYPLALLAPFQLTFVVQC